MQAAHHTAGTFLVPLKGRSPDVGEVCATYVEKLEDEIAEIVAKYTERIPGVQRAVQAILLALALEVVGLLKRRAETDIVDFPGPVTVADNPERSRAHERRIVAAHLGRLLDWICKGRRVPDMGPRVFVVAAHIRAAAVDHRTDQQAANEIGNDSRASINKIRANFRRDLGADYPGENGKSSNTKTRCKNSRINQLQS